VTQESTPDSKYGSEVRVDRVYDIENSSSGMLSSDGFQDSIQESTYEMIENPGLRIKKSTLKTEKKPKV
jgi:hypothetical protein